MHYFLTGATGFIGKFLTERLLNRGGHVHVLVRPGSELKFTALKSRFPHQADRLHAVTGDLSMVGLGLDEAFVAKMAGNIDHFFHLAAIYDIDAPEADQVKANVEGTRHALQAAEQLKAGCFNYASSIAVAGLFNGIFREDMFEEAEKLVNPYLRTKHDAEKVVRNEARVPYRIYRPGMVVGHSKTGEIDKIDGPYFFFRLIKTLRDALPRWMPMLGVEGGRLNIVPVDYVAGAMDVLAHKPGLDGRCFHLTDPKPHKVGEVMNIFARAASAPEFAMRIDARMLGFIPSAITGGIGKLPPVQRIKKQFLNDFQIPEAAVGFINYPTKFDCRETLKELQGTGVSCPRLDQYAGAVWDYWARNLDSDLFIDRTLAGNVKGKVILITGASSGIGKATALRLADTEATILLVARTREKLEETLVEVEAKGARAFIHTCDVSNLEDCDRLVKEVLEQHGRVDVLVNNAGRSIRRGVASAYDRFHDYERTMQLNYFGALRLIMGLLPSMTANRRGLIINISSIGVLTNAPRFSAYVASKSALDAFSRCAAAEFSDQNVRFTTINMPLVRTPMIAPTKMYDYAPAIQPEEAADMICDAMIRRPKRIATRLGIFAQILYDLAPKTTEIIMNTGFKMFPESDAAKGKSAEAAPAPAPSSEQVAFQYIMRGIYW
ncbi:MAG TPA: short chain dehydrogenase [Moraxellaceae bacterium]|nr:short chain dehydrogenase [Moraxellaceae bacterium]